MKWVGIIFKTGRNARGRAEKSKQKQETQEKAKNRKKIKTRNPGLVPYQARPNQKLLGRGKQKKKKTMHECNRHEYAISKRKEFKAW
jgi:hypothetical protein